MNIKVLTIIFIFLSGLGVLVAQGRNNQGHPKLMQNRLQELEKIKIIETLSLDEESSIRFFSRRSEYLSQQKLIFDKRSQIMDEIQELLEKDTADSSIFKLKVNELLSMDKKLVSNKEEFFNNIKDILTDVEIAKLIVVEHLFRSEIQNELRKKRFKARDFQE
ncbi:MAG: hypothetical protein JW995_10755 [Melioribacteraceae bacterium]|nr:hypothetical protein [Melioribacteraceae bacterium]